MLYPQQCFHADALSVVAVLGLKEEPSEKSGHGRLISGHGESLQNQRKGADDQHRHNVYHAVPYGAYNGQVAGFPNQLGHF